ncbi:branched-chain amino acid ABC transporter permease [Nocardioides sp.]|uniref:branched-chain amino acid ABC transporter permease n=1 Tax=Nocardioides sp. TaxID=35761 RepID=UPI00262B991C|nr:branched-chain amino acid ABC transporter permease [Nocardioides sp.]
MDTILSILNATLREAIAPNTAAVAIAVIGLNIHFGFTGLLNIGQAGYMLLGAYGMAISITYDIPLLFAVLIGFVVSFVFSLILGLPTLKLRGDYLAIVTISAAEIVRYSGRLAAFEDFTGGSQGIFGKDYQGPFISLSFLGSGRLTLLEFNYTDVADGARWVQVLGLIALIGAIVGAVLLLRSLKSAGGAVLAPMSSTVRSALVAVALVLGAILTVVVPAYADRDTATDIFSRVVAFVIFTSIMLAVLFGGQAAFAAWKTAKGRKAVLAGVLILFAVLAIFFTFPKTYDRTGVDGWWVRMIAWFIVGLSCAVVFLLVRSPWGRLLRGVREDEDAMRSLGKNVFAIKMQALIIGGMFGSLGGMVYVLTGTVQADSMGRSLTFFAYTALLLGGAATIFGPVLGTIIFFSARILIREASGAYIPDAIMTNSQTEQFSYVVVGVGLMLLVIFRPQGILGNKRELRFNV